MTRAKILDEFGSVWRIRSNKEKNCRSVVIEKLYSHRHENGASKDHGVSDHEIRREN